MAYIVMTLDSRPSVRKALDGALIVGRAADCNVSVDDHRISRHHCRIEPAADGDGWSIIDLNSRNGTVIHGQRITMHRLRDGEEVRAGGLRILFHSGKMPPSRPSNPKKSFIAPAGRGGPNALHETLTDSKAALEAIVPDRPSRNKPLPKVSPKSSTGVQPTSKPSRPLAFSRPPAKPIIRKDDSKAPQPTLLEYIERRLRHPKSS